MNIYTEPLPDSALYSSSHRIMSFPVVLMNPQNNMLVIKVWFSQKFIFWFFFYFFFFTPFSHLYTDNPSIYMLSYEGFGGKCDRIEICFILRSSLVICKRVHLINLSNVFRPHNIGPYGANLQFNRRVLQLYLLKTTHKESLSIYRQKKHLTRGLFTPEGQRHCSSNHSLPAPTLVSPHINADTSVHPWLTERPNRSR